VRQWPYGLGSDNPLQLGLRKRDIAESLVDAGDDKPKGPIRGVFAKVVSSVAQRRLVATSRDANANQPVGNRRLIVASVPRGAEVLLCSQQISRLSMRNRQEKEILRRNGRQLGLKIWPLVERRLVTPTENRESTRKPEAGPLAMTPSLPRLQLFQ
jgi:hypothetical protein